MTHTAPREPSQLSYRYDITDPHSEKKLLGHIEHTAAGFVAYKHEGPIRDRYARPVGGIFDTLDEARRAIDPERS